MADVVATLRGWSATASSNLPADSTTIGTGLDDNLQQIQATVRKYMASPGSDMASATTVDLATADGYYVRITGTTTITGLGTESAGIQYLLRFAGALTFTHNATTLILPGGRNITTTAGDMALMISEGSGNWRCVNYSFASTGDVGEYQSSTVAYASRAALSSTSASNITSISLTAGDWDVSGTVLFLLSSASTTDGGVGTVTSVSGGGAVEGQSGWFNGPLVLNNFYHSVNTPVVRISLSSTTTYYLTSRCDFTGGGVDSWGSIRARRVR